MKFTLSWLKMHLETAASVEDIADKLTALGLEVESIEDKARALAPFVVARVISAEQHPNADKLRVCMVDTGSGTVQVVCGAPNARAGMKGVFAPAGSHIPGTGLDLKPGVIRGIESNGMLCSARELGLGDDHDGIIELPAGATPGESFARYRGLDDPVIEIKITPNRADCLGVRGIARDLAAAGLGTLKPLPIEQLRTAAMVVDGFDSPIRWQRDDCDQSCPIVAGRYFRNIKNGPSPEWLRDRLTSIGLKPISALVDITNFITFDLARPLHVFDAAKITGDLSMRRARPGEKLEALDGKSYDLDADMLVIADEKGVQALGGIMGAAASGCAEATTDVFLEIALFDPAQVARAGRKLGLLSDARYRFERGVDPLSVEWGLEIATCLILEICGGAASKPTIAGSMPKWQRSIAYRPARVESLGGVAVPPERQRANLETLGFDVTSGGAAASWQITPPSWRADIESEADLVEEVLRIEGYDAIRPVSLPRMAALPEPAQTSAQRRAQLAKRHLAARGFLEAVTFSFMPRETARLFTDGDPVALANPISADLDVMRPSILGPLLLAAGRNAAHGLYDAALAEVGPAYADDTAAGQALVAAGLRAGNARARHWEAKARTADAFDAKADALSLLTLFGVPVDNLQILPEAPGYYHPGRSAALRLGPTVLGYCGALHPRVLAQADIKNAVGFEIYLDRLPLPRQKGTARPLLKIPAFQPLERDFAFLVDAAVPAAKLVKAAKGADKALIADARVFDVFAGGDLEAGKKSIALSVTLQPTGHTLTDAEIEVVSAKIVAAVNKATGGTLRQ